MVFAPVGIRCPEHASVGAPRPSAARTMRQARGRVGGVTPPSRSALIAINVLVYLITVGQGRRRQLTGRGALPEGALVGVLVARAIGGDSSRQCSCTASVLHIAFNMLALWWLGSVVEQALGPSALPARLLPSGLAGSAGALVISSPNTVTVGASGAIFGIMGALLVLEYLQTGSFAGQAMGHDRHQPGAHVRDPEHLDRGPHRRADRRRRRNVRTTRLGTCSRAISDRRSSSLVGVVSVAVAVARGARLRLSVAERRARRPSRPRRASTSTVVPSTIASPMSSLAASRSSTPCRP